MPAVIIIIATFIFFPGLFFKIEQQLVFCFVLQEAEDLFCSTAVQCRELYCTRLYHTLLCLIAYVGIEYSCLPSPIGGKSNELNSSHNTLYFVNCPQSRGKVLCLLSIELLSGMGSRLHRCQLAVLGD